MANQEQLAILKKGPDFWNRWRKENPDVDIDLSRSGFRAEDIRGADLSGAYLKQCGIMGTPSNILLLNNANLSDSNLAHSDLGNPLWERDLVKGSHQSRLNSFRDADLSSSILDCANFQNADLREANLSKTILFRTNFHGANLSGADFSHATLKDTILTQADLTNAIGLETCSHRGRSSIDMATLESSGELPIEFLRGCGLPPELINSLPEILRRAKEYYSCFISYSHADKSFSVALYEKLQERGIYCCIDEHNFDPGDNLFDKIGQAINDYDKFLLCCSESSLTSWWVDKEIDLALEKEQRISRDREKDVTVLVPLDLDNHLFSDNCTLKKKGFIRSRISANLVGWEQDDNIFSKALESVVRALRFDQGARKIPPEAKL